MRILDLNKIEYSQYEYKADQSLTGEEIAQLLNENVDSVFKTLVAIGTSKEYYVFMIPVNKELDLKKAAISVNEKNIEMIPFKELLKVTGYVHGGCSPLGMKKDYKLAINESVLSLKEIYFSGGKVGLQVKVKTKDFLSLKNPIIKNLVK